MSITPLTLSDGRTLVLEHGVEVSAPIEEEWKDATYCRVFETSGGERNYQDVPVADGETIRSALFEAQRREIAVKLCAGMLANPDIKPDILYVPESFKLATAILAAEKKGAEQ
jgi:hypothetical protein